MKLMNKKEQSSHWQTGYSTAKIFIRICFILYSCNTQPCNRATFPKILGGATNVTQVQQMDYHLGTDQIGVGAYTVDSAVLGTTSKQQSIVYLYKGPTKELAWGKTCNNRSWVRGIAFSGSGAILACHFGGSVLWFLRTIDGGFINTQMYAAASGTYNAQYRTVLLSSDAIPIVYAAYFISSSSTGHQILSFPMEPIQATTTWGIQSIANTATSISYGLSFGETESIIYNIGSQGTQFIVSRINALTGAVLWN